MELFTGNYENCFGENVVSISGDAGKMVGFEGKSIKALAPKRSWWQEWHDNIGKVPEDENIAFYVRKYYETVLSDEKAISEIFKLPHGTIMLCYERPEDFCHREILAAFLELYYAMNIREVAMDEFGKIKVQKRNKYYEPIKELLSSLIKENIEMHNFESIAAAVAYNNALALEKEGEDENTMLTAEDLKRLADVLEKEYQQKRK